MQISMLAVVLTAFSMTLVNVLFFVGLNYKGLTKKWNEYKRNESIDELLNHAVNKIEIRNMIDRSNGNKGS